MRSKGVLTACPSTDGTRWTVDSDTGEETLNRCERVHCAYCCPIDVRRRGRAIRRASPHTLVTFTRMGGDWVSARKNINNVVAGLKRRGYCWQHSYTVEPAGREDTGAGVHVHAWVNSGYVPERVLEEVCWDLRVGEPDVTDLEFYSDMTYGMKRALDDDTRADHLRLNGRRLSNHTRAFYRARDGSPCSLAVAIGRRHVNDWQPCSEEAP
jgi:hypothetical protein